MISLFRKHDYKISKKKLHEGFNYSRGVNLVCLKCGNNCFVTREDEQSINIDNYNSFGCKGKKTAETEKELKLIVNN